MKHSYKTTLAMFGVLLLALAGIGIAAGNIDFIEGQKLPEVLVGSHFFEPDTKTAHFTVSQEDNFYLINSAGGAITATLPTPSTITTGKCWGAILTTAGNAVTFNAGTYSINGATSTNAMDAAGDSYIICNNGSGYYFLSRYIQ